MGCQAEIILVGNQLCLSGELNFLNVMTVYQKSLPLINQTNNLQFDFSRLTSSNSAGLALIIEWTKLARSLNKTISLYHLSADILSIAKAAGLDTLVINN